MIEYFIPLCTNGILTQNDLIKECHDQRWVPLLAIRPENKPFATPLIPLFEGSQSCTRWCKRNMPSAWAGGYYTILDDDLERFQTQGWTYQIFHPTRRLRLGESLTPEVYYIDHREIVRLEGSIEGRLINLKPDPFVD